MRIDTTKSVTIPLSKTKIVLLLLGAVAFVVAGAWLWTISDSQTRYNPYYVKAAALLSIGFFSMCAVYAFIKLFDGKPGLIISPAGIHDNSSGVSAGHIPWDEIVGIDVTIVSGQKFLTFFVEDSSKYVAQGNFLKRTLNAANRRFYGSPIQIASNTLKVDFQELTDLVGQYYDQYKHGDNKQFEETV